MGADGSAGVQLVPQAQPGEELHRRPVGPGAVRQGPGPVQHREGGPAAVADGGAFAHLHPHVGVVDAAAAVPAPVVPGQGLPEGSGVGVDEAVDADVAAFRPVPALHKDLRRGLVAAHGVEHQPLGPLGLKGRIPAVRFGQIGLVTGIFRQKGLNEFHTSPPIVNVPLSIVNCQFQAYICTFCPLAKW